MVFIFVSVKKVPEVQLLKKLLSPAANSLK